MKATTYKMILWELIAVIDDGSHDYLTKDQVIEMAEAETIVDFMRQKFDNADFSMITDADWKGVGSVFANLANAVDSKRKFGVENKGMALLLAYALEGLQSALRP